MKRSCAVGIVAVLGVVGMHAPAFAAGGADPTEGAFRQAREYTVRVRMRVETPFIGDTQGAFEGAGFLVDAERGWIITNAHVSGRAASQVMVAFHGESYQPARKLYVDSFADIAVLSLDRPVRRKPARLASSGPAPIGEAVGAFGHPLGIPFTGTRGIVSGHTDVFGPRLTQIDATVDHGNSGGPVIQLRNGEVMGIATAGAGGDKRDRINFATPIAGVHRILSILRAGGSPCPPRLAFALQKNDDEVATMRVADSFDPARWPFQPGDSIVAVSGVPTPVTSLDDLVDGLRGRTGDVALTVMRAGRRMQLMSRPLLRPALADQRGLLLDGALIAPFDYDDGSLITGPARILVHSVEPSSTAQSMGLECGDMVERIDGRRFANLDEMIAYVKGHAGRSMKIELRRFSPETYRVFEFHLRDLPGEDIELIGPDGTVAASAN